MAGTSRPPKLMRSRNTTLDLVSAMSLVGLWHQGLRDTRVKGHGTVQGEVGILSRLVLVIRVDDGLRELLILMRVIPREGNDDSRCILCINWSAMLWVAIWGLLELVDDRFLHDLCGLDLSGDGCCDTICGL
jgi:hypothetical protein